MGHGNKFFYQLINEILSSLPVKLSKMGLPAPVPAASLSSEDESIGGEGPRGSLGGEGPRGSFSTTPVINSSVPTQGGKGRIFC